MPIYEEKLISPLALRFTQDHIRTTFRDGRIVEDSIGAISAEPSEGSYDLILRVPFPMIEIIRWHPPRRFVGGKKKEDHWFTLDNRRLYCLQRAALAHWPRRVAAVVQILYADPGAVFKKYDSTTFGKAVNISHSVKDEPISWWDWRDEIAAGGIGHSCSGAQSSAATSAILADDDKEKTSDLNAAEQLGPSSPMNDALSRALALDAAAVQDSASVPKLAEQARPPNAMNDALLRALALDDAVTQDPVPVQHGHLVEEICCATPSTALASSDDSDTASAASAVSSSAMVASVLEEVESQLATAGNDGHISVPQWNERYRSQLGSLKDFLESHPDRFAVVAKNNRQFTVALAGALSQEASSNRQRRRQNSSYKR